MERAATKTFLLTGASGVVGQSLVPRLTAVKLICLVHSRPVANEGVESVRGDILSPRLDADEPLRVELQDFVAAVRDGTAPLSNMELGLQVVQLIEAVETSLEYNGSPVAVSLPPGERRRSGDRRKSKGGMPTVMWQPASLD